MEKVDIIFIGVMLFVAFLGYVLGFGRSLKMATRGIVGVIISLSVCFLFGGAFKSHSLSIALIERVDSFFEGLWFMFGYLYIGTVVYYVCFFLAAQIARILLVKILSSIGRSDNKGIKIINKVLGLMFMVSYCLALLLLFFATIQLFEDAKFSISIVEGLGDGILKAIYLNNPIKF